MHSCDTCNKELQKARGCAKKYKRPAKRPVWNMKCPFCRGFDKDCFYCKGSNCINVYRCPRSISDSKLLPYYFDWKRTNQWPDGRAYMYQPIKLITFFDILDWFFEKHESIRKEK